MNPNHVGGTKRVILLFGFGIVLAGSCETGWMYRAVEGPGAAIGSVTNSVIINDSGVLLR